MPLFHSRNRDRNADTRRVYARYELIHTGVDFMAAFSFLLGSVLFLWPEYEIPAVWLFIVGSGFFMAKPSLRLMREIQLWRMGEIDRLAERETGG